MSMDAFLLIFMSIDNQFFIGIELIVDGWNWLNGIAMIEKKLTEISMIIWTFHTFTKCFELRCRERTILNEFHDDFTSSWSLKSVVSNVMGSGW